MQRVPCLREDEALSPAAQLFADHLLAGAKANAAPSRRRKTA